MKLKIFFCICIALTGSLNLSAQIIAAASNFIDDYSVLDSSKLIVRYSLDFIVNPDKPNDIETDFIVLEVGHHMSKSYSYALFIHDSLLTNSLATSVPKLQISVPPIEVFKNYPLGKIPLCTELLYRS